MENKIIDFIGQCFWWLMFITPLIFIPLAYKKIGANKIVRIVIGLVISLIASIILYFLSLSLIFRNGMGS